ncbi:MAG: YraN family protein [Ardenticatenia bacterium]|nr:YraN family protein [Ardenticatenia bacterium]
MTDRRKADGARAEALAAEHLLARGWVIVARNWRLKEGEIDIVARDGPSLVFVEVRSRGSGTRSGSPEESVGAVKRRRLRLMAERFLLAHRWDGPCRIDVVAVVLDPQGQALRLAHYPDVA